MLKSIFFTIFLVLLFNACESGINSGELSTSSDSNLSAVDENNSSSESNITISNKRLFLPAYFYDSELWQKVIDTNQSMIVVINPDNGAGDESDSHYIQIIDSLKSGDKMVIGYLNTEYASRDIQDIKSEIDRWIELYPKIDGFFFDEVAVDDYRFYEDLFKYIKSKGDYFVALNSGTLPPDEYFLIADNVIVYESSVDGIGEDICKYPQKSTIIAYNTPEDEMKSLIQNRDCEYFFFTDKDSGEAYMSLPSYFESEIETIYPKE